MTRSIQSDHLPAVLRGPRVECRRVLVNGSPNWGTVIEGNRLRLDDGRELDLATVQHLAPCEPTKIICIHMSYSSRAYEQRNNVNPGGTPTYFMKPSTTINPHGGEVVKPIDCLYLNYEGELAVVIGKVCRNVTPEEAWDYIAGFAPALDMGLHSFRDTDAGSMLRVKGADGLCPIGPGLVSGVDVRQQTLRTYRNGLVVQEAHLGEEWLWDPGYMIADVARHITLLPGDILLSGTPAHSRSVDPGDLVELEITNIGRLATRIVAGPVPRASALNVGAPPTDSAEVRRVAFGTDERVVDYLKDNFKAAVQKQSQ